MSRHPFCFVPAILTRWARLILLLGFLPVLAPLSRAYVIAQEEITGESDYGSGSAQTFQLASGETITGVQLHIGSGAGSVRVNLYRLGNDQHDQPLASGTLLKSAVSGNTPGWFTITFDQPYTNERGLPIPMAFELELLTSGSSGWNNYSFSDQDPYPNGARVYWMEASQQYSEAGHLDMAFRILGADDLPFIAADDFDEGIDRALVGTASSTGSTWTHGGGFVPIQIQEGSVYLEPFTDEQADLGFDRFEGTCYVGFDLTVTNAPSTPWALPLTLLGPSTSGANMVGRVFVSTGDDSDTFTVGVDNDKDNPVWWPDTLKVNTTYHLVLAFTVGDSLDQARLYVNPMTKDSPHVAEPQEEVTSFVNGIRLNAYNGSDAVMLIDNLRVTTDFSLAAHAAAGYPASLIAMPRMEITGSPGQAAGREFRVHDSRPQFYYALYTSEVLDAPREYWEYLGGEFGNGEILDWPINIGATPGNRFYYISITPENEL